LPNVLENGSSSTRGAGAGAVFGGAGALPNRPEIANAKQCIVE